MEKLQQMAEALAASIPSHLDRPTIPPVSWVQNGDVVIVILADGRKVSASIQEINKLMFDQGLEVAVPQPLGGVGFIQKLDAVKVDLRPARQVKVAAPAKISRTAGAGKRKANK